ncbi:MAG: hypothetical protein ACW98I_21315 [Candidatus Hodarchaeales archaeon]|jgi:hypothetical protein
MSDDLIQIQNSLADILKKLEDHERRIQKIENLLGMVEERTRPAWY